MQTEGWSVFSGMVITVASGTPFFGGAGFELRDQYGDTHSTFRPELPAFRQTPDPIVEMERVKEDVERMLRAEKLMKEVLGEGRYLDFIKTHQMTIPSKLYKDRYYIVREWGRVEVVENGETIDELCVVPTETVQQQDVVALKKLMLEADERRFLDVANHFPREPRETLSPVRQAFWSRFGRRR